MMELMAINIIFLFSFDANISYDDLLHRAQAAYLQYGLTKQTVQINDFMTNERDEDEDLVIEDQEDCFNSFEQIKIEENNFLGYSLKDAQEALADRLELLF